MANFSVSKVNQFYVASKLAEGTDGHLSTSDGVGAIMPRYDAKNNELTFEYVSPGGVIRTDRINLGRITHKKARKAEKCRRPLLAKRISLSDLNGSTSGNATVSAENVDIIPGENYILGLEFIHYIGMSDQDKYFVTAAVHGTAGMTSAEFYTRMAYSIARNLSREPAALVDIYLVTSATFDPSTDTKVEIKPSELTDIKLAAAIAANTKATGIVVKERILDNYEQGVGEHKPIDFVFSFDDICYNSVDMKWGYDTDITLTSAESTTAKVYDGTNAETALVMGNGRTTADMEYFYMGERGDQERHLGWPNNIRTKYLVDDTKEYDYLTMNFYFSPGDNDAGTRSTKVITIVAVKGDVISSIVTKLAEYGITFKANDSGKENGETDF